MPRTTLLVFTLPLAIAAATAAATFDVPSVYPTIRARIDASAATAPGSSSATPTRS
ncbi:hypothetical protein KKG45_14390 [bacterium]|nr:hypothetical protein [bacterium]MBU1074427.1 hypothetical protein [bacterium]MBU1674339.1 hypothetical protein [bacterium]